MNKKYTPLWLSKLNQKGKDEVVQILVIQSDYQNHTYNDKKLRLVARKKMQQKLLSMPLS